MIDDFKRPAGQPQARRRFDNLDELHSAAGGTAMRRSFSDMSSAAPSLLAGGKEDTLDDSGAAFVPPEQIAAEDVTGTSAPEIRADQPRLAAHNKRNPLKEFGHLLRHPTHKQAVAMAVVAVFLLGGGTAFALVHHKPKEVGQKVAAATPPPTPAPTPKPILSPLTGMPVTQDKTTLPVTGVMIENSADARPQSGLDQAGVVYEAIAEAGITRFLALYQESDPAVLGPVRSARPYYLQWAMAFDAGYAHVGGSPDALQDIKTLGVRDLDQFYNSGAYHRISSRYAPHNMYTSMDALHSLEQSKGYTSSTFTPFMRAAKEAPSPNPTARSIDFDISASYYNVHYDYDAASNSYKRSEGGDPHIDNKTKQQLSPKVVIALAMPYSLMADGYHSMYNTQGSGQMLLFQNGTVTPGTWSKGDAKSQFTFKDASGKDMELNPGQTWITVLSDISKATYKP